MEEKKTKSLTYKRELKIKKKKNCDLFLIKFERDKEQENSFNILFITIQKLPNFKFKEIDYRHFIFKN